MAEGISFSCAVLWQGALAKNGPTPQIIWGIDKRGLTAVAQLKIDRIAARLFHPSAEMPKEIKDEFTDLPVSRQRKYQLRMARDGRCIICGEPEVGSLSCLKHLIQNRERARRVIEATSRLKGARSYRLEQELKLARRQHLKK
jgi:hypothetical protein